MDTLVEKVDCIFEKYLEADFFAGGVCSIRQNGQPIFLKAYGEKNSLEKQAMKTDTIFDLASVTKLFTSTQILQMISRKALKLDTTLAECLPFAGEYDKLADVTVEQLLTHSSGLAAWHPLYSIFSSIEELRNGLKEIELFHKEDQEVVYSDMNYILLGEILKEYHQADLQTIIRKELVSPMGLKNLSFGPILKENIAATEFGNRIEMEMCRTRGRVFSGWRPMNKPIIGEVNDGNAFYFFEGQSGHAGLFGTAEDAALLADLYLADGKVNGEKLINPELVQQALLERVGNRCLGWHTGLSFPQGVGHTGFTGTSIWIVPELQLNVVLLTNRLHVKEPKDIYPFREELHNEILSAIRPS